MDNKCREKVMDLYNAYADFLNLFDVRVIHLLSESGVDIHKVSIMARDVVDKMGALMNAVPEKPDDFCIRVMLGDNGQHSCRVMSPKITRQGIDYAN